jgi:sec-independent protein translocase protein TatB
MHFADSIVIFLLALILFGPKKLPEIARQVGKLMVEFRRASNEFKAQIDDELRTMEQQERQKKLETAAAASTAALPAPELTVVSAGEPSQPTILPPSTGETVSADRPFLPVAPPEMLEAAAVEPHPVYAEALASEQNGDKSHPDTDPCSEPEREQAKESPAATNHG